MELIPIAQALQTTGVKFKANDKVRKYMGNIRGIYSDCIAIAVTRDNGIRGNWETEGLIQESPYPQCWNKLEEIKVLV